MIGKVLGFDNQTNTGVIRASDDKRYEFIKDEWKGKEEPKEGYEIDFELIDDQVKSIFLINTNSNVNSSVPNQINHTGKIFFIKKIIGFALISLGIYYFFWNMHDAIEILNAEERNSHSGWLFQQSENFMQEEWNILILAFIGNLLIFILGYKLIRSKSNNFNLK